MAGYRRQYVINELESNDIRYNYFEKPNLKTINELYNCLDLYIVSSRVEGGPAAIIECATNKTPIISSDVGTANQILHHKSIYTESTFLNAKPDTEFAYKKSLQFHLQTGMIKFNNMFLEAHEKISIGTNIKNGPWGGGNLFAINLTKFMEQKGHKVLNHLNDQDIDIILLTEPRKTSESSAFTHIDVNNYLKYVNNKAIVVHRINECDERKTQTLLTTT